MSRGRATCTESERAGFMFLSGSDEATTNETPRITTERLKPTPTSKKLYSLDVPPMIRREVIAMVKRGKRTTDGRREIPPNRPKSGKSLVRAARPIADRTDRTRITIAVVKDEQKNDQFLPPGYELCPRYTSCRETTNNVTCVCTFRTGHR